MRPACNPCLRYAPPCCTAQLSSGGGLLSLVLAAAGGSKKPRSSSMVCTAMKLPACLAAVQDPSSPLRTGKIN